MEKPTPEELQALHHWMREPDWAENFSLYDGWELSMSLKPQNLIQAAEADLKRRIRNTSAELTTYEHYAFHRAHVRKAKCVRDLLLLALIHPHLATAKANTRLIYGNAALLVEALRLQPAKDALR